MLGPKHGLTQSYLVGQSSLRLVSFYESTAHWRRCYVLCCCAAHLTSVPYATPGNQISRCRLQYMTCPTGIGRGKERKSGHATWYLSSSLGRLSLPSYKQFAKKYMFTAAYYIFAFYYIEGFTSWTLNILNQIWFAPSQRAFFLSNTQCSCEWNVEISTKYPGSLQILLDCIAADSRGCVVWEIVGVRHYLWN